MVSLIVFLAPPIYLYLIITTWKKCGPAACRPSLFILAFTMALGIWSLLEQKSPMGFSFLPFIGMAASVPGLAVARFLGPRAFGPGPNRGWRYQVFVVVILLSSAPGIYFGVTGVQAMGRNHQADIQAGLEATRVAEARVQLQQLLRAQAGKEEKAVADWLARNRGDRSSILIALETDFVPLGTLMDLGDSGDDGILLGVARNPRTPPVTLLKIKEKAQHYHGSFDQAFAANPNSPVELVHEMHAKKTVGLWIAKNHRAPAEILLELSKDTDINVIQSLLGNRAIDCEILGNIEAGLSRSSRPNDEFSLNEIEVLRPKLCGRK
ncbi:MAG: hypothetical protein ABL958_11470 [Bdellovibrionia bacterium]